MNKDLNRALNSHVNRCQEAGNALIFILIAAALFAALSFAVTQGMRGGVADVSAEKASASATELMTFGKAVEQGVQRMFVRGVSENDLCFDFDAYPGGDTTYEHAGCADTANRVFHPDGGGVSYKSFADAIDFDIVSERFSGHNEVTGVGTTCGSATCSDLLYIIRMDDTFGPSVEICKEINHGVGVTLASPPTDTAVNTATPYTGSFGWGGVFFDAGQGPELVGKQSGCIQETSGGGDDYVFYHTILAR